MLYVEQEQARNQGRAGMQASLQASTREEAQGTHTHDVRSKQAGDERQLASLHVHTQMIICSDAPERQILGTLLYGIWP